MLERGPWAGGLEEVGCGSVIKVERGSQLPRRGPQESGGREGAQAQPEEGAVMDRAGGKQIVSGWPSNRSREGRQWENSSYVMGNDYGQSSD